MVYDDIKNCEVEELQNCERVVKVTRKKREKKPKVQIGNRDVVDYVIIQVGIAVCILAVILAVNLAFGGEAVWSKIQSLSTGIFRL